MGENELIDLKKEFGLSDNYLKIAFKSSKKGIDLNISNSTINHANFLIYLLIKNAKHSLKIYSGNLDKDCYDNSFIKEQLEISKKNGVDIKVLLEKKTDDVASIFKKLNILVKKPTEDLSIKNHFIVADDISYRLEEKHEGDVSQVKAKVNFKNRNIAVPLSNIFDNLYKSVN